MSMLAIWICELSGLVQDSCGTKAALSYSYCLWFRLGIIGQLFKRGVILSLLFSYDLYNHHDSFYESCGCGGLATWQYGENTVCVINVVAQSFSSIPASMTHVEARPGWIDLHS